MTEDGKEAGNNVEKQNSVIASLFSKIKESFCHAIKRNSSLNI